MRQSKPRVAIRGDAEPAVDSVAAAPAIDAPASSAPARRRGCIRSGATPAEVRQALGEPDSIAAGWWIYGRTQILFGYGTVQDWIDSSEVVAC